MIPGSEPSVAAQSQEKSHEKKKTKSEKEKKLAEERTIFTVSIRDSRVSTSISVHWTQKKNRIQTKKSKLLQFQLIISISM